MTTLRELDEQYQKRRMRHRIQRLRLDYQYPVRSEIGTILWYDYVSDATQARRAIKRGLIPPEPTQLLDEFGAGIEPADGGYEVHICGTYLDWVPDLESAVTRWVHAEEWQRVVEPQYQSQKEIDARYYAGVQFDKDGYKILNPDIHRTLNG